jgi:hypothetical protein
MKVVDVLADTVTRAGRQRRVQTCPTRSPCSSPSHYANAGCGSLARGDGIDRPSGAVHLVVLDHDAHRFAGVQDQRELNAE